MGKKALKGLELYQKEMRQQIIRMRKEQYIRLHGLYFKVPLFKGG